MLQDLLIDGSIFIFLIRRVGKIYFIFESWLDKVYRYSLVYGLKEAFYKSLRVSFQYSFLGRIIERDYTGNQIILDNSKVVGKLLDLSARTKAKALLYLRTARIRNSITAGLGEFLSSPLKLTGIALISLSLVNVFFSILLHRQIIVLGWVIRLAILFLGIALFYSRTNWESIRASSLTLRYMNNYCKKAN